MVPDQPRKKPLLKMTGRIGRSLDEMTRKEIRIAHATPRKI
jgi:hypothetical protein